MFLLHSALPYVEVSLYHSVIVAASCMHSLSTIQMCSNDGLRLSCAQLRLAAFPTSGFCSTSDARDAFRAHHNCSKMIQCFQLVPCQPSSQDSRWQLIEQPAEALDDLCSFALVRPSHAAPVQTIQPHEPVSLCTGMFLVCSALSEKRRSAALTSMHSCLRESLCAEEEQSTSYSQAKRQRLSAPPSPAPSAGHQPRPSSVVEILDDYDIQVEQAPGTGQLCGLCCPLHFNLAADGLLVTGHPGAAAGVAAQALAPTAFDYYLSQTQTQGPGAATVSTPDLSLQPSRALCTLVSSH